MLQGPLLNPSDDDVFYHYCSVETFQAICERKTIRFSDASMMNDAQEMNWGYDILLKAGRKLMELRDTVEILQGLNAEFFASVSLMLESAKNHLHPFLACFSKEPDVLSQWRAYADDGRGFCVGFSGKMLKDLPASLLSVEYEPVKQIEEATNALGVLYMMHKQGEHKEFMDATGSLVGSLSAFKNPAFRDEREVRCVHLVDIDHSEVGTKFVDRGGHTSEGIVDGEAIKYRVSQGNLVAYFDLSFKRKSTIDPIKQIWLGPKNVNSDGNIELFMNSHGMSKVHISRSECKYR